MLKSILKSVPVLALAFVASQTFAQKVSSKKTSISFYSHTAVEDIKANNYASVSTLDQTTGDVVFSVPMQSFEFEKSLMQKHFNGPDFLDTQKEPKAKLVGKITNLAQVNFKKDGTYTANVTGEMTIKGVTKPITEKATITVKGTEIHVDTKFNLTLADYGVAFSKGKPSTNIAKAVETTVIAEY